MSDIPPAGPPAAPAAPAVPPVVPIAPAIPLAAPVPPIAPAAPVPLVFTLSPGYNNDILDFSQTQKIKGYYKATSLITSNDHFDGTTAMVVVFLATVQDEAL